MNADELTHAKRGVTPELLFRCARRLNEHALATLPPRQGPKPRPAHTALFPHLNFDGVRPSELAKRLGISKQAVGQLVDDLVAMGLVERKPDPADGRAKLIVFTTEGAGSVSMGLEHLRNVETWLRKEVGDASIDALASILGKIVELLDREGTPP